MEICWEDPLKSTGLKSVATINHSAVKMIFHLEQLLVIILSLDEYENGGMDTVKFHIVYAPGLIGILVNDWAALYSRGWGVGLYTRPFLGKLNLNGTKYFPRFMRFLKVLRAFTKWGLIGISVNDWAALYQRGLMLEGGGAYTGGGGLIHGTLNYPT